MKFKIIKFVFLIIIIILIFSTIRYNAENHTEIPEYFLEPDGYLICRIITTNNKVYFYGYINNNELIAFEKKEIKSIRLLHPYEEDKFSLINTDEIAGIVFGEYKDLR